jgi:hypothetical protein
VGVETGLPHQRLKLLGDLHVQLDNTFIGLALAAILGSDREPTEILGRGREPRAALLWDRSSWRCSVFSVKTTEPRDRFSTTRRGRRRRKATPDRDRAPAARSFGVAGALVLRNRGHSLGEFQI